MTDQPDDIILVLITAPSEEAAEQLARQLLRERLAACVNLIRSVHSLYWWADEIQSDTETLLLVKTRQQGFHEHFIPFVKKHHPYQIPEILALPILAGNLEYLQWVIKETQPESS
ncbi:MAG: divalent-cation tolerance protein CutA [Anaerolineales bacterium]